MNTKSDVVNTSTIAFIVIRPKSRVLTRTHGKENVEEKGIVEKEEICPGPSYEGCARQFDLTSGLQGWFAEFPAPHWGWKPDASLPAPPPGPR